MRKRVRILVFAAVAAAVIVPVGFALSLESTSDPVAPAADIVPITQVTTAQVPIIVTTGAAIMAFPDVPDGAKLLAIGSVLFGLGSAMRRTNKHDPR
jgi:uncharacterized membrane protein YedE/YeeE